MTVINIEILDIFYYLKVKWNYNEIKFFSSNLYLHPKCISLLWWRLLKSDWEMSFSTSLQVLERTEKITTPHSLFSIPKSFMQGSNSAESFDLESFFKVNLLTHLKHKTTISTSCRSEALLSRPRYPLEIWNKIVQVGRDLQNSADKNIYLIPPSSSENSNQAALFPSFSLPPSPLPSVLLS